MEDFIKIGHKTNYTPHYVRKVLRGYVAINKRNATIINNANNLINEKRI